MKKIRIGCGAGFSGDRIEPAMILAENGQLDYLVLECLAERTIALAQKRKLENPLKGYDPLLDKRIKSLLPILKKNNVRLITNMGAANPVGAANRIIAIAREMNITVSVAAVIGDDVLDKIDPDQQALETGAPVSASGKLISANAYLGAGAILPALKTDANIIITGRVADPSLFLAPMIHEFSWSTIDYELMGKGTVIGHLLECAGQVSGGYFADPAKKDVQDLAHLGHPFADVSEDGSATISKVEGTGGVINLLTAKEQMLYEVTDPNAYFTPDVIADFTSVKLRQAGENKITVTGGSGKEKPATFKVSVGYHAFFQGEGEISYAGINALGRARLAGDVIYERLKDDFPEIKIDYLGTTSAHHSSFGHVAAPYEVRLRVAAKAATAARAATIGEEVEALYTNGPAGGGGVRKNVHEVIGIVSVLINSNKLNPTVTVYRT